MNDYTYLRTIASYLVSNAFIQMYLLPYILQIVAKKLYFRSFYDEDFSCLQEAVEEDQFPCHFKVKFCNLSDTTKTLYLDYTICHKSPGKEDSELSLNVSIPGNPPMHTTEPVDNFTGTYRYVYVCNVMYRNNYVCI